MSRVFSRRRFLKGAGTTLLAAAFAGTLSGCIQSGIPACSTLAPQVDGVKITAELRAASESASSDEPYTYRFGITLENLNAGEVVIAKDNFQLSNGGAAENWNASEGSSFVLSPGEKKSFEITFSCASSAEKLRFQHGEEYLCYSLDGSSLIPGEYWAPNAKR